MLPYLKSIYNNIFLTITSMQSIPVSVIIPTCNRKHLIGRALDSVLNQTYSCREIIVVDDGSTDGTGSYISERSRAAEIEIKYCFLENSGPAAARNLGIRHAESEFVAFLDSDDHWHKKKIEQQYSMMRKNEEYLISHTKEKWLRRGVHLNQKKKHIPRHGDIFEHCLELCAVGMSTVMARKVLFEKVGTFNCDLRCCEDYDMWIRVSSRHRFLLVDAPLTVKEGGRDDQVSYQYRVGMDKLRISAIEDLLLSGKLSERQQRAARKELAKKAHIYGTGCLHHGKSEESDYYLQLAQEMNNTLNEYTK